MAATRTVEEEAQAAKVFTLHHWICFCSPPSCIAIHSQRYFLMCQSNFQIVVECLKNQAPLC